MAATAAQQLRAGRISAGLTQATVAAQVGTTQATLARWEAGKQAIPAAAARSLAEIYGLDPSAVLMALAEPVPAFRPTPPRGVSDALVAQSEWLARQISAAVAPLSDEIAVLRHSLEMTQVALARSVDLATARGASLVKLTEMVQDIQTREHLIEGLVIDAVATLRRLELSTPAPAPRPGRAGASGGDPASMSQSV
jgi:transcriptional regulator with XRE-family HTH domain